jgi:hypothetical protein
MCWKAQKTTPATIKRSMRMKIVNMVARDMIS